MKTVSLNVIDTKSQILVQKICTLFLLKCPDGLLSISKYIIGSVSMYMYLFLRNGVSKLPGIHD